MPTKEEQQALQDLLEQCIEETGFMYVALLPLKHGKKVYRPGEAVPVAKSWEAAAHDLVESKYLTRVPIPKQALKALTYDKDEDTNGAGEEESSNEEPQDQNGGQSEATPTEIVTNPPLEPQDSTPPSTEDTASDDVKELEDEDTSNGEEDSYDPSDHTAEDVVEYAEAHPDEVEAIIAAEKAGKGRKTIINGLATSGS